MSAHVDGRRDTSRLHRQRRADGQSIRVECLHRSDGLQLGDRPAAVLDVSDTDLRNARYLDTHRVQVRAVVQIQSMDHQSRTPQEWSRCPGAASRVWRRPSMVTDPVTVQGISYRVAILY